MSLGELLCAAAISSPFICSQYEEPIEFQETQYSFPQYEFRQKWEPPGWLEGEWQINEQYMLEFDNDEILLHYRKEL